MIWKWILQQDSKVYLIRAVILEPVCFKKRQKIVGLVWGPLKVLNGTKLILDDHGNNLDSFKISLESFRSFRGPLLHKPVTGQELFFAIPYSKPALIGNQLGRVFFKKDKINSISSDLLGWEFDVVLFWRKPSTAVHGWSPADLWLSHYWRTTWYVGLT